MFLSPKYVALKIFEICPKIVVGGVRGRSSKILITKTRVVSHCQVLTRKKPIDVYNSTLSKIVVS